MGAFTGNNQNSSVVRLGAYDTGQWTLSVAGGDTMTATVVFQKSDSGNGGWETVTSETAVGSGTYSNDRDSEIFIRLRTTAHSGDDVNWALTISDDKYDSPTFRRSAIQDTDGETVLSLRKGAITFPQDLVIEGALTVNGLNLSTANLVEETVAGGGTFTPSFTTPTHYKITLTGSSATFANPTGSPTGNFPVWVTIINSSGGVITPNTDISFGSEWDPTNVAFDIADSQIATLGFIWDNDDSELRQVAPFVSVLDPFTIAGNITSTGGSVSAGTTVTAGTGVTATTGNIAASSGNVSASGTVTGGTGVSATTGNVTAASGNIIAGNASMNGTTDLITTSGNITTTGTGSITAANGITATSGGMTVTAGGIALNGGNLTANGITLNRTSNLITTSGNITTTGSGTMTSVGDITTSGGKFTGQNGDALTFVTRGATGWDYTATTLNETSTSWLDLDISSIVGTAKRWVLFRMLGEASTNEEIFGIRENGGASFTAAIMYSQVANVTNDKLFIIPTDTSGVVEYRGDSNVTVFNLAVIGWWREA